MLQFTTLGDARQTYWTQPIYEHAAKHQMLYNKQTWGMHRVSRFLYEAALHPPPAFRERKMPLVRH